MSPSPGDALVCFVKKGGTEVEHYLRPPFCQVEDPGTVKTTHSFLTSWYHAGYVIGLWRQMLIFWLPLRAALHHNGKSIPIFNQRPAFCVSARPVAAAISRLCHSTSLLIHRDPPSAWVSAVMWRECSYRLCPEKAGGCRKYTGKRRAARTGMCFLLLWPAFIHIRRGGRYLRAGCQ